VIRQPIHSLETIMTKERCPQCNSSNLKTDGDMVEPLEHPDHPSDSSYFLMWWDCQDCGHQWRYQDDSAMTVPPSSEPAFTLDGMRETMRKIESLGPVPPRPMVVAHPDLVNPMEVQFVKSGFRISDIDLHVSDSAMSWVPPKSKSPFIEYDENDEHWLRLTGAGILKPAAFLVNTPEFVMQMELREESLSKELERRIFTQMHSLPVNFNQSPGFLIHGCF
jgi:hypothetical protein